VVVLVHLGGVVRVGYPQRSSGVRGRAPDILRALDQQDARAIDGADQCSRHPRAASANDDDVEFLVRLDILKIVGHICLILHFFIRSTTDSEPKSSRSSHASTFWPNPEASQANPGS